MTTDEAKELCPTHPLCELMHIRNVEIAMSDSSESTRNYLSWERALDDLVATMLRNDLDNQDPDRFLPPGVTVGCLCTSPGWDRPQTRHSLFEEEKEKSLHIGGGTAFCVHADVDVCAGHEQTFAISTARCTTLGTGYPFQP